MGFEIEDCQSALEAGNNTLESAVEWYAGFLLGAENWLFLPSIPVNVTGYHETKNVSKIIETSCLAGG